jgi:NAD(P)-dependent dehydrogenase (short-subunit alcohol dehydrogenase family)
MTDMLERMEASTVASTEWQPLMNSSGQHLLLFGGTGAIGSAVASYAAARGWSVTPVSRNGPGISYDPFDSAASFEPVAERAPYSAVCWAQGVNAADTVYDVDIDRHLDIYRANCVFILATLQELLTRNLLTKPARLCVISSIWQNLARQTKLSYCMSKAALEGLVLSASTDLASEGHLFNAVLPGALETPMTRRNLSAEQLQRLTSATRFERLPALEDVASVVFYLCSSENTGITGQFIAADLGFSRVRIV